MMLVPSGNLDVVYLAEPDVSFFVTRTVVPFRNSILPVGVPDNDETAAVNVTDLPCTEGFAAETSVVVVKALPVPESGAVLWLPVPLSEMVSVPF